MSLITLELVGPLTFSCSLLLFRRKEYSYSVHGERVSRVTVVLGAN